MAFQFERLQEQNCEFVYENRGETTGQAKARAGRIRDIMAWWKKIDDNLRSKTSISR